MKSAIFLAAPALVAAAPLDTGRVNCMATTGCGNRFIPVPTVPEFTCAKLGGCGPSKPIVDPIRPISNIVTKREARGGGGRGGGGRGGGGFGDIFGDVLGGLFSSGGSSQQQPDTIIMPGPVVQTGGPLIDPTLAKRDPRGGAGRGFLGDLLGPLVDQWVTEQIGPKAKRDEIPEFEEEEEEEEESLDKRDPRGGAGRGFLGDLLGPVFDQWVSDQIGPKVKRDPRGGAGRGFLGDLLGPLVDQWVTEQIGPKAKRDISIPTEIPAEVQAKLEQLKPAFTSWLDGKVASGDFDPSKLINKREARGGAGRGFLGDLLGPVFDQWVSEQIGPKAKRDISIPADLPAEVKAKIEELKPQFTSWLDSKVASGQFDPSKLINKREARGGAGRGFLGDLLGPVFDQWVSEQIGPKA